MDAVPLERDGNHPSRDSMRISKLSSCMQLGDYVDLLPEDVRQDCILLAPRQVYDRSHLAPWVQSGWTHYSSSLAGCNEVRGKTPYRLSPRQCACVSRTRVR